MTFEITDSLQDLHICTSDHDSVESGLISPSDPCIRLRCFEHLDTCTGICTALQSSSQTDGTTINDQLTYQYVACHNSYLSQNSMRKQVTKQQCTEVTNMRAYSMLNIVIDSSSTTSEVQRYPIDMTWPVCYPAEPANRQLCQIGAGLLKPHLHVSVCLHSTSVHTGQLHLTLRTDKCHLMIVQVVQWQGMKEWPSRSLDSCIVAMIRHNLVTLCISSCCDRARFDIVSIDITVDGSLCHGMAA